MKTFFEHLAARSSLPPSAWCRQYSEIENAAYGNAAEEALQLANFPALLIDRSLAFRSDITVNYLGVCDGNGTLGDVLSFQLGADLEVVVCKEQDEPYWFLAYRGDRDAFELVSFDLRLFEGECFADLRDNQAAA